MTAIPRPVVSLADIDGVNGFRLDGADTRDFSGYSVSSAGDVNGDGFDDVIVGAFGGDPGGDSYAGESYVVFGSAGGVGSNWGTDGVLDLASLDGTNGFRLDGIDRNDRSGAAVSSAGDVNGDGFDDVIVGAFAAGPLVSGPYGSFNDARGESYVVFGSAGGFGASVDLATLDGTDGFRLDGIDAGDNSGRSVSSAGDVNGDGFDDIIIDARFGDPNGEASGESYVVFGSGTGFAASIDLSILNGSNGFRLDGIDNDDQSGRSVSGAGDVNGDGFDDILVSAYRADGSYSNTGETYVVFGSGTGFAASLNLSSLNGANGFRIDGIDENDRAGISVSSAGDVNGDGIDDVIIGAAGADANGSDSGEAYVVFGSDAGFAASLDLASLNGTNGFRLDGVAAGDSFGRSVSAGGDVNGDGIDDIVVGARRADPNGNSNAGSTYVVFGSDAGFAASLDPSTLNGANGFRVDGIDGGDQAGFSVSGHADVNGDGFDDVIVGAYFAEPNGTGESYVVFGGNASGFQAVLDLSAPDLGAPGGGVSVLEGLAVNDRFGWSVSDAGDVNGDGFDDVIVGTPYGSVNGTAGESYVVFGSAAGLGVTFDPSTLNGTNGFRLDGIGPGDRSGYAVSSAGDVNGDGFDDVILGARLADGLTGADAGESYIVFGAAGGFAADLDLSTLNGTNGVRLDGVDPYDRSGVSVSSAGDVNGDGFDDVIVGGWLASPGGSFAGESYVVFGSAAGIGTGGTFDLGSLNGTNGFRIDGSDAGDNSGRSVSSAGDVNGDGFDDLLVGAYGADPTGGSAAGETYVVFGSATGAGTGGAFDLSTIDGTNGFRFDGIDPSDFSGRSVSGAGDVNGDGFADIAIGARSADPNGNSSGEAYVVFGTGGGIGTNGALDLSALDGTNGFLLEGLDSGDRLGISVSGAGDVNGDGFDDIVVGAYSADPAGGNNAGQSFVVFGSATGFAASIDLAALDGTDGFRIDGIDGGDQSGRSVSGAGDVNGDGFDDLIVGAPYAGPNGATYAGESYLIYGRAPTVGVERTGSEIGQTISGGAFDDILSGLGDDDVLRGLGGDDILNGGEGADAQDGGDGSDTATYEDASAGLLATLTNTANNTGEAAGDTYTSVENLTGSAFTDALIGNADANVLTGGGGGDFMAGLAGDDTLLGGDGSDRLEGGLGADALDGGDGNDVAFYRNSAAAVNVDFTAGTGTGGEAEGDTYVSMEVAVGSGLDDTLVGGGGLEALLGGAGNDVLDGRGGDDRMFGSFGNDTFRFQDGHGTDRILDFTDGEDLLDYAGHTGVTGLADLTIFDTGTGNTIIQDGAGGQVVLLGVASGAIDASDFVF